jgi:hypothetical protein
MMWLGNKWSWKTGLCKGKELVYEPKEAGCGKNRT